MKKTSGILCIALLVYLCTAISSFGEEMKAFAPNVDLKTGAISVPENYTRWAVLGTWAHSKMEGKPGVKEYHVVYTQPETIEYYKKNRRFPDGAVLVKELLNTETMPMTTGPAVSHATKIKGWFVLVRDAKERFKDSKLWGDGWGWSLFNAPDSKKTVSKDYRSDCVGCHLSARELADKRAHKHDKWVYTLGYPVLRGK